MRFTSFDGSLAPKVVRIIESYNKLRAFFVIFRVFREFIEIFGANFGSADPLFADGGGLRDSESRNNSHASAYPAAGTFSISRVQSRTCSGYAEARK